MTFLPIENGRNLNIPNVLSFYWGQIQPGRMWVRSTLQRIQGQYYKMLKKIILQRSFLSSQNLIYFIYLNAGLCFFSLCAYSFFFLSFFSTNFIRLLIYILIFSFLLFHWNFLFLTQNFGPELNGLFGWGFSRGNKKPYVQLCGILSTLCCMLLGEEMGIAKVTRVKSTNCYSSF